MVNTPINETDGYRRGSVMVDWVAHRSPPSHTTGTYYIDRYALFGIGSLPN